MKKIIFLLSFVIFNFTFLIFNCGYAADPIFRNPSAGRPEVWVYRSLDKKYGDTVVMTETCKYVKGRNNSTVMQVVSKAKDRKYFTTMVMESVTMMPVSVTVKGETQVVQEAKYSGSVGDIQYVGLKKKEHKRILTTVITYDQRTLFWVLRGYPFLNPKVYEIDLVMPLGNRCSVKVRYMGIEEIAVPAGKFKAYKLEVEPDALIPVFSANLKTYFWYSVEKIPRFIKYEYPHGRQSAELIK